MQTVHNGKGPGTKTRGAQVLERSKNNPIKETFNFQLTSVAQKHLCLSSLLVGASDRCKELGHRFDSGRGLRVLRFLFHARHMLNITDIYVIYNVAILTELLYGMLVLLQTLDHLRFKELRLGS